MNQQNVYKLFIFGFWVKSGSFWVLINNTHFVDSYSFVYFGQKMKKFVIQTWQVVSVVLYEDTQFVLHIHSKNAGCRGVLYIQRVTKRVYFLRRVIRRKPRGCRL